MALPPVSPTKPASPVLKVDPAEREPDQRHREARREQADKPPPADPCHVDTHV